MFIHPSIENYVSTIKGEYKEFFSDKYYAIKTKDMNIIKGKEDSLKYISEIKTNDVKVEREDSHYLIYYNNLISKVKVDDNGIVSIVEEEKRKNGNVQLFIEYDGSSYNGAQKLPGELTIQSEIEKALNKMLKRDVEVVIASRTDKGVHALRQSVSFESFGIDASKYKYSLNLILPSDINVVEANNKSQLFDARYDVVDKTYEYIINTGKYDVFKSRYMLFDNVNDLDKINKELKAVIGTHDFKSFEKGDKGDSVRTIYKAEAIKEGEIVKFIFNGNGFLHNMIRFIVGSVLNIDKTKNGSLKDILESKSKNNTPYLADACGLYLVDIKY